ncbi:histone-fold-containing protein [Crepidotus variabilis]|uniref:DNA polymerase epsilon subunit D n=1 Tax=Crepidotus variabilis TaxID=179855 RepID=A0A9P6EJD9_9AGAR|nr:histone-fold-containing protein [Crepidotus variabilis]
MPRKEATGGVISAQAQQDMVSEGIENYELPKSTVMKIAKTSIPDNVKLQKETVLSLVKGSTVFINYLAATAHDVAQSRQHKSISASDVLKALEIMQFGSMTAKLQDELNIYRENSKQAETAKSSKKGTNGSASAAKKTANTSSAASKGKGKEKMTTTSNPLPPPFPSTPLEPSEKSPPLPNSHIKPLSPAPVQVPEYTVSGAGEPMDVDYATDPEDWQSDYPEGEEDGMQETPEEAPVGQPIVLSDDEPEEVGKLPKVSADGS